MLEIRRTVIGRPLVDSYDCVLRDIVPTDIGPTLGNETGQGPWNRRIYSHRFIHTGFQVGHVVN